MNLSLLITLELTLTTPEQKKYEIKYLTKIRHFLLNNPFIQYQNFLLVINGVVIILEL